MKDTKEVFEDAPQFVIKLEKFTLIGMAKTHLYEAA